MKLYIGGSYQGKLALALEENKINPACVVYGESCGREDILSCQVLSGFHAYVRRYIKNCEEGKELVRRLSKENPYGVFISDEVGCGVVPLDQKDRELRELVGRCTGLLAHEADEVIHVVCGIGMKIK